MTSKSDNLFHFTKSPEFVKGILLNGFMPRYCLEDVEWIGIPDTKFFAYPMVCFCDIPLSRISDHSDFFGSYGLGLTKNWGLKNRLAPAIYATPGSAATKVWKYLFEQKFLDVDPDKKAKEDQQFSHLYQLMTLTKPISGNMVVAGKVVAKDFDQENEWRFVPEQGSVIDEKDFPAQKDAGNKLMESHKLSLAPTDVKYVFVKEDNEIPDIVDFVNTKMGHFPHNDLKILTSRIISLETIYKDL